jgi:hypothetical protein
MATVPANDRINVERLPHGTIAEILDIAKTNWLACAQISPTESEAYGGFLASFNGTSTTRSNRKPPLKQMLEWIAGKGSFTHGLRWVLDTLVNQLSLAQEEVQEARLQVGNSTVGLHSVCMLSCNTYLQLCGTGHPGEDSCLGIV